MATPTQDLTAHPAESFLAAASSAASEALARVGCLERAFKIGGAVVRCRFAGPALIPSVEQALRHRAIAVTAAADLTITIWDEASTGVAPPGTDGKAGSLVRGHLPSLSGSGIECAYEQNYGGLFIFRTAGREAILFAPSAPLPSYEQAFPLRTIFGWWLGERGIHLIHAGAVGLGDRAVLLTGIGGSGKSNTTLACVEAGMNYFGDDYVGVTEGAAPSVHGLYCSAKVFPGDAKNFPRLGRAAAPGSAGEEKSLFFLEAGAWPMPTHAGIQAILLPRVAGTTRTSLRPASPMDALKAVSFSTLAQRPASNQRELSAIARLVRSVPSFHLELGTDRCEVAASVHRFIEEGA